jgi:protein tyrosine kinase modulator
MNTDAILSDLLYYAGLLRRRFFFVLLPCVVVFGAAVAIAFSIPPVYRSSATILVESQQIPQDLVRSTVTSSALQRMEVIRQRVMARESVLRLVQKFGLYSDEIASLSATQIVDRFRSAAAIGQILLADSSRPEAVAFKISFDYGDPVVAAQVANELVSSVLDEDLRTRSGQAAETKRFLTDEVERLQHELNSVEAEIGDYKAKHSNFLPETLGYRQSALLAAQTQIALIDRDIQNAEEQGPARASQGDALLDQTRLQLEQARATLTELHPTVRRLVQQVRELENAAQTRQAAQNVPQGEVTPDPATQEKIKKLTAQREDLQRSIQDIEAAIAQTSQVELGLSALLREQTEAQRAYREVNAKLAQAETGQRLEEDRQAQRLEVIEPPIVARAPVSPNRPVILLLGLFAGAAVGVGPVAAWEVLDPRIKRARDLERKMGRRALGLIPAIETDRDIRRKRRNRILVALAFIAVIAAALFAIEHFFTLSGALNRLVDAMQRMH